MAHIAAWKTQKVKELADILTKNPVIGVVSISNIPSPQIQQIRKNLRGKVTILVSKNTLFSLALKEVAAQKKDIEKLAEAIDGQSAVVVSKINPFKLYKEMEATKAKAPAKGGELAPEDIVIKEGELPFKPGPIVGELQKASVPAAIESGKVIVKKDKLMVKAGDKIPKEVAQVLTRLEIYPLIVGLDLKAAYEDGIVYKADVLQIDETILMNNLKIAANSAFNIAMRLGYITPLTLTPLLQKAYREAVSLSLKSNYPTKETIKFLLAKANTEMFALTRAIPSELENMNAKSKKEVN